MVLFVSLLSRLIVLLVRSESHRASFLLTTHLLYNDVKTRVIMGTIRSLIHTVDPQIIRLSCSHVFYSVILILHHIVCLVLLFISTRFQDYLRKAVSTITRQLSALVGSTEHDKYIHSTLGHRMNSFLAQEFLDLFQIFIIFTTFWLFFLFCPSFFLQMEERQKR